MIHAGYEAADTVCFPKVDAAKTSDGIFRTIGKVGIHSKTVLRIGREEFKRAAKIVGRLRSDGAGTLRDARDTDIIGYDGAADVEAVVISVGRVAQGNSVQCVAKLVLIEATDRDPAGPFIGSEGIG